MSKAGTGRRAAGGFTLVEMMVGMLASSIMVLGVMNVLASNQREYNQTYERANGRLVREATEARLVFDHAVRKASVRYARIGSVNEYAEVFWYASAASTALDRYTQFYVNGTDLVAEHGQLALGTFNHSLSNSPTTQVLAHHVTAGSCTFTQVGPTLSMALVLNDGRLDLPIVTTATRHNE